MSAPHGYEYIVVCYWLSAIAASSAASKGNYVLVGIMFFVGIYYSLLKSYYEDKENPNG